MVKSLFDFKENQKYKKLEDSGVDLSGNDIIAKPKEQKTSFNFASNPFTSNNANRSSNSGEGVTIKPPVFSMSNPFKIPGTTSNLFTSGKSLFDTSNVNPAAKKWTPPV